MSATTLYADLPFVRAGGDGGPRPATQVVVIHATDNTASAAAEASYAQTRPDKTSAHFYADEQQVIQAVDLSHIAYGCLYHGNRISIQFELAGLSNHIGDATLRRVAPIVARVCKDWGIPVRKISAGDVSAGTKGICGHGDITAAFPQDNGDHTDPGAQFPWSTFISYIEGGDVALEEIVPATNNASLGVTQSDVWNAVCNGHSGYVPTQGLWINRVLNGLVADVADLKTKVGQPAPVMLTDADLTALAQKIAALLPSSAAEVVDEFAHRLSDG